MRWLIFCVVLLMMSCEQFEAELPTYIQFDDIQVASNLGKSSSTAIRDLWIYIDQELQGIYPVAASLPVIQNDQFSLEIFAGIRQNGINEDVTIYPFYEPFRLNVMPEQGNTIKISPEFCYSQTTKCPVFDDFSGGLQFQLDLDEDFLSKAKLENGELQFMVTEDFQVLEVAQNIPVQNIPVDGSPVFLEMDYKAEGTGVFVGLLGSDRIGNSAVQYKLYLFPDDRMKKVFINFSTEIQASQFDFYQLAFRVLWDDQSVVQNQVVTLDNLKLLHF